ncbi:MAG: hypothetical protein VKL42_12430 [Snowella sp.]|nr:hypothetical protein [Snowella sp.]
MGQAKWRQQHDPYFGKNKTLLHQLIEKCELFEKPQNVYLGAFMMMTLKPIVVIDMINYNQVMVVGFDDEESFPKYLEDYKESVFETDFSAYNVLIIATAASSLIVHIDKPQVERSLEWAEYKGLEMKTSDSVPQRIANYDLTGVK